MNSPEHKLRFSPNPRNRGSRLSSSRSPQRSKSRSSGGSSEYRSSKHKSRHRDRERSRSRERSRERNRSRDRQNDRSRNRSEDRSRDIYSDRIRDRSTYGDSFTYMKNKSKNRDECSGVPSENTDRETYFRSMYSDAADILGYRNQTPNTTIMVRGLSQDVNENDIHEEIVRHNLQAVDIRLIRKKGTSLSRGYAFVEFETVAEAIRWMEIKQGILTIQNKYCSILQYGYLRDVPLYNDKTSNRMTYSDWFCVKCGALNFKRRENCFKCVASRMESEKGGSGSDEISVNATKTIMIRNLDALSTEESVAAALNSVIPDMVKLILTMCIGRDPLTGTSRGICYIGTECTIDAIAIRSALVNLKDKLVIDGKVVSLSYCKFNMGDSAQPYIEFEEQEDFPFANVPTRYDLSDVNRLAEYASMRYARTTDEYFAYFEYYKSYFSEQINAGNKITLHPGNQIDEVNAAAAVAQTAIQQLHASKDASNGPGGRGSTSGGNSSSYRKTSTVANVQHKGDLAGLKGLAKPNEREYVYDQTTGFYYDPTTGLYYIPSSNYFWNPITQQYLYWCEKEMNYVLLSNQSDAAQTASSQGGDGVAAAAAPSICGSAVPPQGGKASVAPQKKDKLKDAKRIAKDMERWAKTMNQKKEMLDRAQTESNTDLVGAADIGFAVLENNVNSSPILLDDNLVSSTAPSFPSPTPEMPISPPPNQTVPIKMIMKSASKCVEIESEAAQENEISLTYLDFTRLICRLCKRQLASKKALIKHAQMSDLHKKNLEELLMQQQADMDGSDAGNDNRIVYKDRAKERRMKYGEVDIPQSHQMGAQQKHVNVNRPIGEDNLGNKLLQRMGWSEGQGLGKANQGRTTIIQADRRSFASNSGLNLNRSPAINYNEEENHMVPCDE